MFTRFVGFAGLAFVTGMATLLGTVIVRSPDTHDHIASTLRPGYERTPLDTIATADLPAIVADLPAFRYPEPPATPVVDKGAGQPTAEPGQGTGQPTAEPTSPVVAIAELALEQKEFGFNLERIEVQAGVPVQLTVTNVGDQVHGIWIPDFAISEDIRSGKSKTVEFIPKEPGRVRFTCSYNLCGTEEEHARMAGFIVIK